MGQGEKIDSGPERKIDALLTGVNWEKEGSMRFRSFLYRLFRFAGDVEAVDKGPIEERITRGGGVTNTKDLIEYIAKALVNHPEQVKVSEKVSEIEGERTSIIELSVAKEDFGKVIGKQGRTVTAVRIILGAVSAKLKRHSVLNIIEPQMEEKAR
jgi:uncharacterized protein